MPRANDTQHGGNHYKTKAIEPWDYIAANGIGYFEGNAIKYLSRWKDKNGLEDLKKALHYVMKLIEVEFPETSEGSPTPPQSSTSSVADSQPSTRAGWRYFTCDECGQAWRSATRDRFSPSRESCDNCGEFCTPCDEARIPIVEVDSLGNLLKEDKYVFKQGDPSKLDV